MRTERALSFILLALVCAFAGRVQAAGADPAGKLFSKAETHFQKAEYKEALNAYKNFADHFPNDPRAPHARFTAAFILQKKMRQPDEACKAYQNVIEHHSTSRLAFSAQYQLAQSYESSGQTRKALQVYKALKKQQQEPNRPQKGLARMGLIDRKVEFLEARDRGAKVDAPGWGYSLGKEARKSGLFRNEKNEKEKLDKIEREKEREREKLEKLEHRPDGSTRKLERPDEEKPIRRKGWERAPGDNEPSNEKVRL